MTSKSFIKFYKSEEVKHLPPNVRSSYFKYQKAYAEVYGCNPVGQITWLENEKLLKIGNNPGVSLRILSGRTKRLQTEAKFRNSYK